VEVYYGQSAGFREASRISCIKESYGTKMAEAVAPASLTASATVAKTGRPRCVDPAFLGFVPPTTVVPIILSERLKGCGPGRNTYHSQLLVAHETCELNLSINT
jgi:hypothetical protein